MTTPTTTDVLIVGAGPTGLTMATLLAHNGVRVRIVDKKAGLTRETRAAVVHAKILELFDKLDLTDKAIAEGEHFSSAQFMRHGKITGKLSFFTSDNDKRTPYPFALIYGQDQTERLLLHSLEETGVDVKWYTEMLGMEQTADGVHVRIRAADGNEETVEAQWVIGADGSHSLVRHALSLGFVGETYTNTLFHRRCRYGVGIEGAARRNGLYAR